MACKRSGVRIPVAPRRTRAEVAANLRELQAEQDLGARPTPGYTVQQAVDDWLAEGLDGRSAGTVTLNRNVLKPVTAIIGDIELRKLTAHDVRQALTQLANNHSSRTVVIAHNALTRALRHAEANRHILHNAAALVDTPKGQRGRRERQAAIQSHLQGCGNRRGLDTAGTTDKLRQPALGLGRAGGRDRPASGHSSSRTTEVIYRREIRPVLVKGAEVMDQLFG